MKKNTLAQGTPIFGNPFTAEIQIDEDTPTQKAERATRARTTLCMGNTFRPADIPYQPGFAPTVAALPNQHETCGNCGNTENVTRRRMIETDNVPKTRLYCPACGFYRDGRTGTWHEYTDAASKYTTRE